MAQRGGGDTMQGVGLSIGEANKRNLVARRMKRGECPTCGNKTHKVGFFGKKTALTIEGTCLYGRCLLCNPVEGYMKRPQENSVVPRNLVITTEDHLPDDGTMVSGITMDHRLIVGARNWNGMSLDGDHEDDDGDSFDSQGLPFERPGLMRPEPSVGTVGIDDGRPPDRRRPTRDEGSFSGGRPMGPPRRYQSRQEEAMDNMGMDGGRGGHGNNSSRRGPDDRPGGSGRRYRGRQNDHRPSALHGPPQRMIPEESSTSRDSSPPLQRRVVSPLQNASLSPARDNAQQQQQQQHRGGGYDGGYDDGVFSQQRGPNQPDMDAPRDFHYSPGGAGDRDRDLGPERRLDNSFGFPKPVPSDNMSNHNGSNDGNSHHNHSNAPGGMGEAGDWDDHPIEFSMNRETHFDGDKNDFRNSASSNASATLPNNGNGGSNNNNMNSNNGNNNDFRDSGSSGIISSGGGAVGGGGGYAKAPAGDGGDMENTDMRYGSDVASRHTRNSFVSMPSSERNHFQERGSLDQREQHAGPVAAVGGPKHDDYGRQPDGYADDFHRDGYGGRGDEYGVASSYNGNNSSNSNNNASNNNSNGMNGRASVGSNRPDVIDRNRRGMPDDDFSETNRPPSTQPASLAAGNSRDANVKHMPRVDDDYADLPEDTVAMSSENQNDPTLKKNQTVTDIPIIIHCLNLNQANAKLRERAFNSLADIVLSHGQKAKDLVKKYSGIETLVESMWADMSNVTAQGAACRLLFALAASFDGDAANDVLVGESAESAVDALLISMQTHLSFESIQRSGCGTLCCLASASGSNLHMSDGTLSGAVLSVVNAMAMHRKSIGVQEWGIRALYNQCLLSVNAESNRKNLAQSGQDGGAGVDVIHVAMETTKSDLVTIELACRLYWCLSSSDECAKILARTPEPINAIMNAVHLYRKRPEAAPMTEAAYGALANLARISDQTHDSLRDSGAIPAAMESIGSFHFDEELYVEACALLNNLALNPMNKSEILSRDAINIISRLMQHNSHNSNVQEQALSTLLALSADSVEAKMSIISEPTMATVVKLLGDEKCSTSMKELACALICSLSMEKEGAAMAVSQGAIEAVFKAIKDCPRERRLQEAALMTLRNFACMACGVEVLLQMVSIRAFVGVMQALSESVVVQLNACCAMWNMAANSNKEPTTIHDGGGIEQIVRAMQSHMESGELLEMACGTLWSLIDRSEDRKKSMVGSGAIDAVTCALVMHPKEPETLEKACGLLANICTQGIMAEAIADSQGISMVVEAMRNNNSALTLLELGTLVLRNMVLVNPEYAMEASNGISTIMNAMKENPEAISFQREACNALWALAAQSEDCKSKIVALDGVQILMSALENNTPKDVHDAARGAINQLARSSAGGGGSTGGDY